MSEKLKPNFTPIPNIILDEIMRTLSPTAVKVIFAICRFTYGWGKQSDRISLGQLAEMTGMERRNVHRTIKQLGKLLIVKPGDPSKNLSNEYRLNVDISNTDLVSQGQQGLLSLGQQPSVRPVVTETLSKDNQRKKNKSADRKKRDSAAGTNPDPRVRRYAEYWCPKFLAIFGEKYPWSGKDGKIVKDLLPLYGLERLIELGDLFFEIKDEFVNGQAGFTIGVFKSRIATLISTKRAAKTERPMMQELGS
jgi:phage replication O-like protein O